MIRKIKVLSVLLAVVALLSGCATQRGVELRSMVSCPDGEDGYENGVSACFAGCIGDRLIMAGGCNFPVKGEKRYYKGIYAADVDDETLSWQMIGELPKVVAYGVTVADGDSLVMIGGNDKEGSFTDVYSVHIENGKAVVRTMPSLPYSVDNMAGAVCDGYVYVTGGNQNGKAGTAVLRLDLKARKAWEHVAEIPGKPRVQPVCASASHSIYVWGGFVADGEESAVHTDGWRYDVSNGRWTALSAPKDKEGREVTLSGGIAYSDGREIVCLGGVNRDIFLDAISGRYQLVKKEEYLNQPVEWYRFNPCMLVYDVKEGCWRNTKTTSPQLARAGAMIVASPKDTHTLYYIGGEKKPGVRSNEVVVLRL